MVIIFFQECRCDTVSQECEFLETLKYSSHHCETPKSTEIVKIAIFSGFSDFRSFWAWPFSSITELLNPRDAPTPENTNLKNWCF